MKRLLLFLTVVCCAAAVSGGGVRPSVELFLENYTKLVAGKRVGLVTNRTGVNRNLTPTVDLLKKDARINLVALFAPEHGIRSDIAAGEHIGGGIDLTSGLPVYSLYGGKDHRPTKEQLAKIDCMVFHLQDIGTRTYTYIWHMAEVMAACGEAGKPVIILDVPNPNGMLRSDGPIREEAFKSFIGLHPVPYTYSMTCGELARYLKNECGIQCKLFIVPMRGYRRNMSFTDTGLPWVPTSPQIPSVAAANGYPVTGPIGTLGTLEIGIGQTLPFQIVVAPGLDGNKMAAELNWIKISGVRFLPHTVTPTTGPYKGRKCGGVQLFVTDAPQLAPIEAMIHILCYLRDHYSEFSWGRNVNGAEGFDKALGTDRIRKMIQSGKSPAVIIRSYQSELASFRQKAAKYYIYP